MPRLAGHVLVLESGELYGDVAGLSHKPLSSVMHKLPPFFYLLLSIFPMV